MNYLNELTEKENYYFNEAKRIGSEKGDCKELRNLYKQASLDYNKGVISKKAHGMIYAICMDYAYPR